MTRNALRATKALRRLLPQSKRREFRDSNEATSFKIRMTNSSFVPHKNL